MACYRRIKSPVDSVVGQNVQILRIDADIDIATAASIIDVAPERYASYEAGYERFEALHLYHLARALRVSISDLFGYRDVVRPITRSGRSHLKLVQPAS